MKLLVVEDDADLGAGLRQAFRQAGYEVVWARSGAGAGEALEDERFGCVVLDMGLPDADGLDVLRRLRSRRDTTPVLILSARDRPEQKIAGLDAGADDYLTKPFDLDELLARVRVQARRGSGRAASELVVGDVTLDVDARTVAKAGVPVALAGRELKLLALLMSRANRFVARAEIEAALYEDSAEIGSNTVEAAVYTLRRRLGQDFVVTARGLGYMVRA